MASTNRSEPTLLTFGEAGPGHWRHGLRSGQTAVVQEAGEVALPQGQPPPETLVASSHLVEKWHGKGPHSAHNEEEKGPFQAGTESKGVWPHNLVGSW